MEIKIDIWSDYACPFCFIGKKNLEKAIAQFSEPEQIQVRYRSFQLDPDAKGTPMNQQEIAQKRGMTVEALAAGQKYLTEKAKKVGLDLHFDTIINANTMDSHRLGHYAATKGKEGEMTERLLHAYLADSLNIADRDTLVSLASDVGLDKTEVLNVLESDAYKEQVVADIQESRERNITGVPYFVFNGKYALSGAQPASVFLKLLNKVRKEDENQDGKGANQARNGDTCTDGSCNLN